LTSDDDSALMDVNALNPNNVSSYSNPESMLLDSFTIKKYHQDDGIESSIDDFELNKFPSDYDAEQSDTKSESLAELFKKLRKAQKSIAPSKLVKKEAKLEIARKMFADISKQKFDYDQKDALLRKEAENIERKLDFLMKPTITLRPLQSGSIEDPTVHKQKRSALKLVSVGEILPDEMLIKSIATETSTEAYTVSHNVTERDLIDMHAQQEETVVQDPKSDDSHLDKQTKLMGVNGRLTAESLSQKYYLAYSRLEMDLQLLLAIRQKVAIITKMMTDLSEQYGENDQRCLLFRKKAADIERMYLKKPIRQFHLRTHPFETISESEMMVEENAELREQELPIELEVYRSNHSILSPVLKVRRNNQ
jgi:hypothetical protein